MFPDSIHNTSNPIDNTSKDSNKLLVEAAKQNIFFRTGAEFSTLGLYQDCFRINFGWPITKSYIKGDEQSKDSAVQRYQQLVTLCELANKQLILDMAPTNIQI